MSVTKCLSLSCVWLFVTPWPGSFVHGILQARILEWVAISFSRGSSQARDRTLFFCTAGRLFTHWGTREAGHGRQQIILLCLLQASSRCYLGHGQWVTKFGGLSPERCFIQGICFSLVSSASLSKIFGKFLVPFLNKESDNKPRWEKKLYLCAIPFYRECNCGWVFTCWGISFHFLLNLYPEIDFHKCFFPSVYQIGKYENT